MAQYKILVADRIAPSGVAFLREQPDVEVVEAFGSTPEQLQSLAREVDAVVVRSESRITAAVIATAQRLKAVGRAGVGVDNIDVEAATERGIVVMNTPDGNTLATAELTLTHILCGARPVAEAHASMRAGKWDRKTFSGTEVNGKTIAIVGLGRIGTEVARRAQAFGMKVLAVDPFLSETRAKALDVEMVSLEAALPRADYLTVHMPLTEKTRYMIGREAFARMKPGVRIFNVARGGLIEETALIEALKSGRVAAAGLDVFEEEPLPLEHPFRKMPNVVLTPHLGASTQEAQESVGLQVAEAIVEALRGGVIRNAVNAPTVDAKSLQMLRPYLRLGTLLGTFLQQMTPDRMERIEITYFGSIVDLDAMPLTRSIQRGYLLQISGSEVNDVNAPMKLRRLGVEVKTTKSNAETDYSELIEVRAVCPNGVNFVVQGTLLGRTKSPRLVHLNGRDMEITLNGHLLLVENQDRPGMVGQMGTLLGREGINIANLSLHRGEGAKTALAVYELDSPPSVEAMEKIHQVEGILKATLVKI